MLSTSCTPYLCTKHLAGDSSVISALKAALVTSGEPWTAVPLRPSADFAAWANPFGELGLHVHGVAESARFGSKACLHRSAAQPHVPSVVEQIDPDIRVCRVLQDNHLCMLQMT